MIAKQRWYFKAFAILLLPGLLFLLIQSVYSGMAYVDQFRLNAIIDQWKKSQTPPALNTWLAMERLALASLHDNEHNVDLINASGRLYAYRSTRMSTTRKQKLGFGHKAINYYSQVIRLRPAWPYGWMNLAVIKAQLGEVDQEFKPALQQLLRLGPWEKNTLPTIIQLSLYAWPYLHDHTREPLLKYYLVAQQRRKQDVLKAITDTNQLRLYCAIVTHTGDKASFCP